MIEPEVDTRALGWQRFKLLARAVGGFLLILAALWAVNIVGFGAAQGSFASLHETFAIACAASAVMCARWLIRLLGQGRDHYDDYFFHWIAGLLVLGMAALAIMFMVFAVLGLIDRMSW